MHMTNSCKYTTIEDLIYRLRQEYRLRKDVIIKSDEMRIFSEKIMQKYIREFFGH
jgi:hypothetical protein